MSSSESDQPAEVDRLVLKAVLPTVITAIRRRQVGLIEEDVIDRLVAAGWIRWKGGALDVTPEGALISEGLRLGPQPGC